MAITRPGDLITIAELAEILGCSLRSAQNGFMGIREIPKIRLGDRMIRYRRRDVEDWLNRHTLEPYKNIETQRRSA